MHKENARPYSRACLSYSKSKTRRGLSGAFYFRQQVVPRYQDQPYGM